MREGVKSRIETVLKERGRGERNVRFVEPSTPITWGGECLNDWLQATLSFSRTQHSSPIPPTRPQFNQFSLSYFSLALDRYGVVVRSPGAGFTMTLNAVYGLTQALHWTTKWDYFINLSASDLPLLRTVRRGGVARAIDAHDNNRLVRRLNAHESCGFLVLVRCCCYTSADMLMPVLLYLFLCFAMPPGGDCGYLGRAQGLQHLVHQRLQVRTFLGRLQVC